MANEGHIIVKGSKKGSHNPEQNPMDVRRFFTPVDKGSARPAFCHPKRKADFEEGIKSMEKKLEHDMVDSSRKMAQELNLKERKERLDQLNHNFENAKKIIAENPDAWAKRRKELAKEIKSGLPTRKDVREHRVNPFANLKREKEGGLEAKKREYTIISRAMAEESNTSFLQQ